MIENYIDFNTLLMRYLEDKTLPATAKHRAQSEADSKRDRRLLNLPSVACRPTFIVHRLNAELARICNPIFRRLGVDLITSRILVVLLEQQQAYIGDIVDIMALPQSTVSHQLKRLENVNLVKRQADKADQRAILVTLTRKGKGVAAQCDQISAAIYEELFSSTDDAQIDALVERLSDMEARLKAINAASLGV